MVFHRADCLLVYFYYVLVFSPWVRCLSGSVTSGEIREDKLMPSCGKENSYSTGEPLFLSSPEKNRKIGHDLRATKSPKVRRAPLGTLDVNSPIKVCATRSPDSY